MVRASYWYWLNEGPTQGHTDSPPFQWDGDGDGDWGGGGGRGGRYLGLVLPHLCVFDSLFPGIGLLPVEDKVGNVSQVVPGVEARAAWGRSPGVGYMGSTLTQARAPRTHRNLVCWSFCAPGMCLYTSCSCQTRKGCEARALGEPLHPEPSRPRGPLGVGWGRGHGHAHCLHPSGSIYREQIPG